MRKNGVEAAVVEWQRINAALPEFNVGDALCLGIRDRGGDLIRIEIQSDHPTRRNAQCDIARNGARTATAIEHADARI